MAEQRPSRGAAAAGPADLYLGLLRDLQCVLDLNSEVSDGALELAVAEKQLDGPEVPGPTLLAD